MSDDDIGAVAKTVSASATPDVEIPRDLRMVERLQQPDEGAGRRHSVVVTFRHDGDRGRDRHFCGPAWDSEPARHGSGGEIPYSRRNHRPAGAALGVAVGGSAVELRTDTLKSAIHSLGDVVWSASQVNGRPARRSGNAPIRVASDRKARRDGGAQRVAEGFRPRRGKPDDMRARRADQARAGLSSYMAGDVHPSQRAARGSCPRYGRSGGFPSSSDRPSRRPRQRFGHPCGRPEPRAPRSAACLAARHDVHAASGPAAPASCGASTARAAKAEAPQPRHAHRRLGKAPGRLPGTARPVPPARSGYRARHATAVPRCRRCRRRCPVRRNRALSGQGSRFICGQIAK